MPHESTEQNSEKFKLLVMSRQAAMSCMFIVYKCHKLVLARPVASRV